MNAGDPDVQREKAWLEHIIAVRNELTGHYFSLRTPLCCSELPSKMCPVSMLRLNRRTIRPI